MIPQRPLRIAVVGGSRASEMEMSRARQLGGALASAGAVVLTGGLGGVMEAASQGCAEAGGLTVGLLPGRDADGANAWVRVPLATGMGEGRNVLLVRSADAVVSVGGEWGTVSEIALALKIGRPVLAACSCPVAEVEVVEDVERLVERVCALARDARSGRGGAPAKLPGPSRIYVDPRGVKGV